MRAYDVFLRVLRRSTDVPAAPPGQISLEVVDTGGDPQLRMVDADGVAWRVGGGGGGPHWEVLMADGVTAPPEPLQNEAEDDWLYGEVA